MCCLPLIRLRCYVFLILNPKSVCFIDVYGLVFHDGGEGRCVTAQTEYACFEERMSRDRVLETSKSDTSFPNLITTDMYIIYYNSTMCFKFVT